MTEHLTPSGFAEFDRLVELFMRTRDVLERLVRAGELPVGAAGFLADEAIPYVETVEAGFRSSLRASEADLAELRRLVRLAGIVSSEPLDAAARRAALGETLAEQRAGRGVRLVVRVSSQELVAIDHARLVFAVMPRVPEAEVHWPIGRRAYADISPPRRPSELVERIEELERELWRTAAGRPFSPLAPAARRTFGFFDAAVWLGSHIIGGTA